MDDFPAVDYGSRVLRRPLDKLRVGAALDRAVALAEETRHLVARVRKTVHDSRNRRHHAGLLRALARLTRRRPKIA